MWLESGIADLRLAREGDGKDAEFCRRISLLEKFLAALLEVLYMWAQYFIDITENGPEEAQNGLLRGTRQRCSALKHVLNSARGAHH